MSRFIPHQLQCPHCGNMQETPVWDSVNVTLHPELKAKFYAVEINFFECEKCGEKAFINAPLLYHDMNKKFCVQYYPEGAINQEGFLQQFNADGSLAVKGIPAVFAKSGAYLSHPHIVFDMNEMIRYIQFRDALAALDDE